MRYLLCLLAIMTLNGCGFSPIYGKDAELGYGTEDLLAYTFIEGIPNREGQYLRNALIDRFYRYSRPENPAYTLEVTQLQETLTDLDITKSSDATRGQLRINANMLLKDRVTNEILLQRELQSITSYNILSSEFATRISEDNTRLNALDDLARQIELQLNLFFKRQK